MGSFLRSVLGPLMEMDSGGSGGGEPAPAQVSGGSESAASTESAAVPAVPAAEPVKLINPLLRDEPLYREDPSVIPAVPAPPTVPEIRKLNFGGREVPVIDPVVEDLHKDYTELTRSFTQTTQTMKQLEMNNAQLQQMVQNFQMLQQQQPAVVPQAPVAPTPEELEAQKEAFMESFYADPRKAISDMAMQLFDNKVAPVIAPIQKDQEFHAEANRMANTYSDFSDTIPAMQHLVGQMPELENLGLEKVYQIAKAMGGQAPAPLTQVPVAQAPETPETPEIPVDPRAALMKDPAFRNEVFNQMILEKQQQQSNVPTVMGNQPGGNGNIPIIPENKPQSIREGSKALLRHLGL